MNPASSIILLTSLDKESCQRILPTCHVVHDFEALQAAYGNILLSYGTSIIVPQEILNRYPGGAYNIHAGSPDYPGRDPHHWAVYEGAQRYGATAHVMTNRVDEGAIVDVEWFHVNPTTSPSQLLEQANTAALKILLRIAVMLQHGEVLVPMADVHWGKNKRSRADFKEMCQISAHITPEEFESRFRAFDGDNYNNLQLELHGYTFRIEKNRSSN